MINQDMIERGVSLILRGIGANLADRNFLETPERVARFYLEMFGRRENEYATFTEEYSEFILLRGHRMFSLCPHHLLPVEFTTSIAYIPNGAVLGLSKLGRLLDECNSGPLLQEKFTKEIITQMHFNCPRVKGVACLVTGTHSCIRIRGIKSDASFVTYRLDGSFKKDLALENRFFQLAGGGNGNLQR